MLRFFSLFLALTFLFSSSLFAQSLQDKIGQMLMVGLPPGDANKDTLLADISERNLGGVLMFAYNIDSPGQIAELTTELQEFAPLNNLFLATDQEGGIVARLDEQNGYERTYSAEKLGEDFNSEDSTRAMASQMASWLSEAGFNVNFAPVVDVKVARFGPAIAQLDRSFNANEEVVYQHASWFADEMHKENISTALKHFPGHGSAMDDSHHGFTDISDTWREKELVPFQQFIDDGYSDMIMTGHLFKDDWDDTYPASISHATITEKLRNEMGFQGVVVSDELFMRAIQDNFGFDEAVILAVNAGTDILLFNTNKYNDMSLVRYLVDLISRKVEDGTIATSVIDAAYNRILKLKKERIPTSTEDLLAEHSHQQPGKIQIKNYPNPFNPATTLEIQLAETQHLSVEIFNMMGQKIQTLADNSFSAGVQTFHFDGSKLASGIYLVRVTGEQTQQLHKMTLVK